MKITFPVEIFLSPTQKTIAHYIGKRRQSSNENAKIKDLKTKKDMDSEAIHIQGFASEFAFGIATNLMPDFNIKPQQGTIDFTLPCGISVDVKSTTRQDGNLIEPVSKLKNLTSADICVLVIGELPLDENNKMIDNSPAKFTIYGWAWTRELRQNKRSLGMSKECFFLSRNNLHKELDICKRP